MATYVEATGDTTVERNVVRRFDSNRACGTGSVAPSTSTSTSSVPSQEMWNKNNVVLDNTANNNTKVKMKQSCIWAAKVAVAIAIIRATPSGVTAEEHARRLVGRFRAEQLSIRQSNSRLQREVLALRQQLLQTQLTADDHPFGTSQQDGQQPFTQEEDEVPLFPTPPCSAIQEPPMSPIAPAALTRHAHFLQVFLRLRQFQATPTGVDMKQWESNIQETVFDAVSMLTEAVRAQNPSLPIQVLVHAARAVVCFAETDAARTLWCRLSEALGHFLQAVIENILTDEGLDRTNHHEELCSLILVLSSCSRLRTGVMTLLTHYISEYGRFLLRVRDGKCELEAHAYEAMRHVFRTLERVMEQEKAAPGGALEGAVGEQLRDQLENSLLHISDDFPLFALNVWHLVGVMDSIRQ